MKSFSLAANAHFNMIDDNTLEDEPWKYFCNFLVPQGDVGLAVVNNGRSFGYQTNPA